MNWRKFYQFIILLIVFIFANYNVSKALQISEIHFDPAGSDTDREWIEVYNEGQSNLDLTEIIFFEANVNHGIDLFNTNNSTDKNINANEYVVVVQDINKFKIDFPNYSGKIFKASFSLSNTGEFLALKDKGGTTLFSVTYTQNDKQANPSPGAQNLANVPNNNTGNTTSTTTNSTSTTTQTNTNSTTTDANTNNLFTPVYTFRNIWPEVDKIYVKAGDNQIVLAGQTFVTQPKVLDNNKKEIKTSLQYRWNFGDGNTSEEKNAKHFYKFPGEYIIYLEVNYLGNIESDKFYLKVIDPDIDLSFSEIKGEMGINILNENNTEINLGEMFLKNEQFQNFTIPKNTFILPKRSVFLTYEALKFSSSTNYMQLSFPNGRAIAEVKNELQAQTPIKVVDQNNVEVKKNVAQVKRSVVPTKVSPKTGVSTFATGTKIAEKPNRIEFKNDKPLSNFNFFSEIIKIWSF